MKAGPRKMREMILGVRKSRPGSGLSNGSRCQLQSRGWNDEARRSLQRLLSRGAGRRLPVVFDFDNTIISGDVGEAVLAVLAAEGRLTPSRVSKTLCPSLHVPGKGEAQVEDCSDIMEYYEALLNPTVHGKADLAPFANGYVWATQVLENLSVAEVLRAAAKAFEIGRRNGSTQIEVTSGKTKYPAPRFYEEMVELIAELLRLEYDPWIVSASNVWSVRWMVVHGLNPLLARYGISKGLPADRVVGLATLLADSEGCLLKDSVLVREDQDYAALQSRRVASLFVTRHLQFPAPVYSGKVACIVDALGCNPYLCAGDSPSDHPMMSLSRHRLWIARRDKPEAQRATRALIRRTGKSGWILQACSGGGQPCFLSSPCTSQLK